MKLREDELRQLIKAFSDQYIEYTKIKTQLLSNLSMLIDQSFPGLSGLFVSIEYNSCENEKWIEFATSFWHCKCVSILSLKTFTKVYKKWCKRNNCHHVKAGDIYTLACASTSMVSCCKNTKSLISIAASQVSVVSKSISDVTYELICLAKMLPEYPIIITFQGVDELLGSRLMAEIGDIRRFQQVSSLVCYAGFEAFDEGKEHRYKSDSQNLRNILFLVMDSMLKSSPIDDPVYQLMECMRSENEHYYSYVEAAAIEFLRIYYTSVKEYISKRK